MDPLRHIKPAQKFVLARQLRRAATPAERYAWSLLRNRGVLGLKFRRQHVLLGFIVDFYCVAERLVLDLEGDAHDGTDQLAYDAARAALLEAAGYRVVRVRNADVTRERLEAVLREALDAGPSFPLSRRERGPGGEDFNERERGPGGEDLTKEVWPARTRQHGWSGMKHPC